MEEDTEEEEQKKHCSFESSLIVTSVLAVKEKLDSVVEQGKENFRAAVDVNEYIRMDNKSHGIVLIFRTMMPAYAECMENLGVKTRSELEALWGKHYRNSHVRESVELLLDAEENHKEFIAMVDKELMEYEEKVAFKDTTVVGQELPKNIGLIDVVSGDRSLLETYWKESKFTLFILLRHFG